MDDEFLHRLTDLDIMCVACADELGIVIRGGCEGILWDLKQVVRAEVAKRSQTVSISHCPAKTNLI